MYVWGGINKWLQSDVGENAFDVAAADEDVESFDACDEVESFVLEVDADFVQQALV